RTAYFLTFLQNHRRTVIEGGGDCLKSVGNLPQHLAACGMFDVVVGEAGNLLVPVQNHAQPVAACAFFEEGMDAAGAPQRYDVSLSDHEQRVGEIGEQARGGIEAARGVNDHIAIVIHQQVEQAGQFGGRGGGVIRLLRGGKKMQ